MAASAERSDGILYAHASDSFTYSAKPPSTSMPSGRMCSHRFGRFFRQYRQIPQYSFGLHTTRSPIRRLLTPLPAATTSPTSSWPRITPGLAG